MKLINILFLVLIFIITGCGTTKVSSEQSAKTASEKSSIQRDGYVFKINGISIAMNAETAPILKQLGKEKDYFEAPSCAFQGLDKTYSYNGFDLDTYEKDGVDYVAGVAFTDDTVATTEGVSLFAKKEDVFGKYGKDYTQKKDSYTYKKDGSRTRLVFLIKDDEVTSIEYRAIINNNN